jgi:hypothetical protein
MNDVEKEKGTKKGLEEMKNGTDEELTKRKRPRDKQPTDNSEFITGRKRK